jgi:hypothetical protein
MSEAMALASLLALSSSLMGFAISYPPGSQGEILHHVNLVSKYMGSKVNVHVDDVFL